jgi:hypothetical protein
VHVVRPCIGAQVVRRRGGAGFGLGIERLGLRLAAAPAVKVGDGPAGNRVDPPLYIVYLSKPRRPFMQAQKDVLQRIFDVCFPRQPAAWGSAASRP